MRFQFNGNQRFQLRAIEAVADLFRGQPRVTIDFDTLNDRAVTIRERDSMEQERIPIAGLVDRLRERFA